MLRTHATAPPQIPRSYRGRGSQQGRPLGLLFPESFSTAGPWHRPFHSYPALCRTLKKQKTKTAGAFDFRARPYITRKYGRDLLVLCEVGSTKVPSFYPRQSSWRRANERRVFVENGFRRERYSREYSYFHGIKLLSCALMPSYAIWRAENNARVQHASRAPPPLPSPYIHMIEHFVVL